MMKSTTTKNALLGIAIAIVAAYMFPVFLVTLLEGWQGILLFFNGAPLLILIYTFWLVIPLGAALGILIPRMARGKNRWTAALQGAGFGAIAGLAAAFCFISTSELRKGGGILWILTIAYCALWVSGCGFYCAKNQSLYR